MQKRTRMGWLIGLAVLVLALSGVGNSTVFSQDPLQKIESDDALVQASGTWTSQAAAGASGGSYLFSSGSPDDVLSLTFEGSSLVVIYVAAPQLGILAVEVDGTVLRSIFTGNDNPQYNQQAGFNYLSGGTHTLRLYASDGVVGVDALIADPTMTSDSVAVGTNAVTSEGFDKLAALGEVDAALGPTMTLYDTFADTATSGVYLRKTVNYLVNVMGDWDGDGHDTYGTVYDGKFDYTNVTPDRFTNAENESATVNLGLTGDSVVGRFDAGVAHDCIGIVAPFSDTTAGYVLNYVCDFANPVVHQQFLGNPMAGDSTEAYSFAAGDFDGDGVDTIAVLSGPVIVYTNDAPTIDEAQFSGLYYWGELGQSATLVAGDWDGDGVDSFGVVYGLGTGASEFYRTNDLTGEGGWLLQRITGTSRVASWR